MPTTEQVRQFIREYPDNVKGIAYQDFVEMCNYYFPRVPIMGVDFDNKPNFFRSPNTGGLNLVYRSRPMMDKRDPPFSAIADISYIPEKKKHLIERFGRANKIQEPMFYGSLNLATACIETGAQRNDFKEGAALLTVGVWIFEKPLVLAEIPPSIKYWKQMHDAWPHPIEHISEAVVQKRTAEIRSQLPSELDFEIMQFFADAFARYDVKCDEGYFPSNYYADRIFGRIKGFDVLPADGILYPSVSNAYENLNIVLKPSAADGLKFLRAYHIWMVNHMKSGGGAEFIPLQGPFPANGEGIIQWRD